MPAITPEVYTSMGLNDSEYAQILDLLGREPTLTELGMFAVMWSEHCGYKYSRPVLAAFSRYKAALEGEGFENAGVVDIGDGLGVTFKIESHNHPSAVEPYQGAATGVGGIIRDILTMGARPIALLNSLRFGPIGDGEGPPEVVARNRYLFERVVEGIAGYGNCVGVPTVAGEVAFHPRYSGNPLVNAMCVGIVPLSEVTTAAAAGTGNPVIYLGSATGKDGIHGATFASETLDEESESKRPNVQIGDPFAEKQLIEATLEALQTGAVVAIQDMGAAGLTCSTVEMASKGGVGMRIDLDKVPMREQDMTAYELMLSESQERMMAVAERGREDEVLDVFRKWGLPAAVIGEVTDDPHEVVLRHGEVAARFIPAQLSETCPTYTTPVEVPAIFAEATAWRPDGLREVDPTEALRQLLDDPSLASKRWVYEQYDHQVQTQTVVLPGQGDAAVLAPRGTQRGLAVTVDGNGRQAFLDPYVGGLLAVCEAARNVACVGARPRALTDGLNFGNPQLGHVYWQFKECVQGLADAAEALGTPVVSGNVSFYNQSELGEVFPTAMVGMLGVLERADRAIGLASPRPNGELWLIHGSVERGEQEGLGASAYLAAVHGLETGRPVSPNLAEERALGYLLAQAAHEEWIDAAHDVSEGGMAFALAEIAMAVGDVDADLMPVGLLDGILFGETPGQAVVAVCDEAPLIAAVAAAGLRFQRLGNFARRPGALRITVGGQEVMRADAGELRQIYDAAIPRRLE